MPSYEHQTWRVLGLMGRDLPYDWTRERDTAASPPKATKVAATSTQGDQRNAC